MKKIILITLATATVLTPVASQAANVAPQDTRRSIETADDSAFQRGEGRRGEGRGDQNRRGREGDQRIENRGPRNDAPRPQVQQQQRGERNWSQERNRGDGQRGEYRRQNRPDASQQGRYYDRNRDGNLDRRWDRNRDDRLDRNWRNDRRYDWRGHRDRYRSYYSPGRYYSPYRNRSYSRLSIGLFLGSGYYGSSYWINDPSYYRLPPAYGSYRWVRYYDDVLLIDLRSGRVVDVIYDFFW